MAPLTIQQSFESALQHHQAGRLRDAEQLYRQILTQQPVHSGALHYLGVIAHQTGQHRVAADLIRRSIALNANSPQAHNDLGLALVGDRQLDQAITAYRQAISLNPAFAEAHNNLGIALKGKGEIDQSIAVYRQAIALNPNLPEPHSNLGLALKNNGQLDEAIAAYRQAIALQPDNPETYSDLGNALRYKGDLQASIAAYHQAIALRPNYAAAHSNLGSALRHTGQLDEAIASYRRAIALQSNLPQTHHNLANSLKDKGELDQAISAWRQAIALNPNYIEAHSNLLYALQFHFAQDPQTILEEHHRWNRQFAAPLQQFIQSHSNDRDPDRRLRIGYVSPDFRDHCQSYFTIPLFAHHNHDQFEIFCYANVPRSDTFTDRIRDLADTWRSTVGMSDQQVADLVRSDRIDILVDLTMHMANGRPLLFARKPAPVQVAWLAYPGTTGLDTIDYRLTDPYLDPPDQSDEHYSEKSIRLPDNFWCYQPLTEDLEINSLPVLTTGQITFGCLNNFCKINDGLLQLWSSILKAVPNSRMILMSPRGDVRRKLMEQLDIEAGRIEFVGLQPRLQYLKTYHRIDIGLDTYPVNGHTTSLDAFWMGVPVITRVGGMPMGRAGWCQLSNLGLTELAAQTPEQLVRIAADLAKDLPRLQELRTTLRQRMEQSPLMDAPRFARNIEVAYRQMWRTWCQASS